MNSICVDVHRFRWDRGLNSSARQCSAPPRGMGTRSELHQYTVSSKIWCTGTRRALLSPKIFTNRGPGTTTTCSAASSLLWNEHHQIDGLSKIWNTGDIQKGRGSQILFRVREAAKRPPHLYRKLHTSSRCLCSSRHSDENEGVVYQTCQRDTVRRNKRTCCSLKEKRLLHCADRAVQYSKAQQRTPQKPRQEAG